MNIDFLVEKIVANKNLDAVITNDKTYTFHEIYDAFTNAREYITDSGIQKGTVVAIISDFNATSIALLMALIENDCILTPISLAVKSVSEYLRIAQCEFVIDLSGPEIKLTKTEHTVTHKMLLELRGANPGLILFSSGTTGEPKAALHNLCFLMEKFKKPGKVLKTITFLLFDHIGGFNTLFHTLSNGGEMVLVPSRDADIVCKMIEKYKVELLPTSPTFLNLMILDSMFEKYDLSCLKMITYGTEPMPQSTLDVLSKCLPNVKLKQTYGLSEVGIVSTKSEKSDSLWIKIGGEGVETKIVDDILYIRSKSAMTGYLNAPNPFDEEGWFNTKDKIEQRDDGYIKILGRITDLINIGGEKVYPNEVEGILLRFNGVKDARVFGEKNPLTGNIVVAEIFITPENNNKDFIRNLRKFCIENMEKFKVPVKYNLVEHPLFSERMKKRR
jgi:acyl-CoA synthetase (AMP-forming)/AMP-acid ligase II